MRQINKLAWRFLIAAAMLFPILYSCSKGGDGPDVQPPLTAETTTPSKDVMLQTFYWDVTEGGIWWDNLNGKLDTWKNAGITALWLPVISKGQSGKWSMGYDPADYFDFGKYDQYGTVETRFGSETELLSLLTNAKGKGFKLVADIVLNHNSGGEQESNPVAGKLTYTKFQPKSGKFFRSYSDFHPNAQHVSDEGSFGDMPDLCHDVDNVKSWFWLRDDGVGKYYKNVLGFDGWRFDYVKGFSPNIVKTWNANVGGSISIGEYWDGNVTLVNDWCKASQSGAFDFPLFYGMRDAFNGGNLSNLDGKGLIAVNPEAAYTFVDNHDLRNAGEDIVDAQKMKAYCYILTATGTPFIFYSDYESLLDKSKLNQLIWIRKNLAAGSMTKLYSSSNEYIFRRNGTPGLLTYLNIGTTAVQQKVRTTWGNSVLKDYTGNNPDVTTDASGYVTISCQPNSYAVYSVKGL